MKRKRKVSVLFLLLLFVGCGSTNPLSELQFNDNDIKIRLVEHQSDETSEFYLVEVEYSGELEINHLNLYISYPIIQSNGTKGNPFKIEGRTDHGKPIKLKNGESVIYTINAPIREVFGDSTLLDFRKPEVELNGFVISKDLEIPFGLFRGYGYMK